MHYSQEGFQIMFPHASLKVRMYMLLMKLIQSVTYGPCMDHVWVTYGSHVGHMWVTYGSHMGHMWVIRGSCMNKIM